MTQEDKNLLFKDLCARLPYGVKGLHRGNVHDLFTIDGREANNACIQVDGYDAWFSVDNFKPYLCPMSSMTYEEWLTLKEWIFIASDTKGKIYFDGFRNISAEDTIKAIDYIISHHFDYRGLIEKGLALEAPEGIYKSE